MAGPSLESLQDESENAIGAAGVALNRQDKDSKLFAVQKLVDSLRLGLFAIAYAIRDGKTPVQLSPPPGSKARRELGDLEE